MTEQRITIKGPVDAITAVPHVLGFHPEDSVVILSVGGPHARADHPHTAADMLDMLEGMRPAFQHWADRVNFVVCYTDDREHALATATMLREELPGHVLEPLLVHEGHFWQLDDDGFEGEGHRYVASDLGLNPLTVAPSRADVRRDLESGTVSDEFVDRLATEAMRMAQPDFDQHAEAVWIVDRLTERAINLLDDTELARISAAVAITELRDVVLACLNHHHLPLLKDAVRRCGPVAGMRALLAFDAWLAGDGALAWTAIDLALEVDPDYSLCTLVATALNNVVPPSTWEPPALTDLPALKEA